MIYGLLFPALSGWFCQSTDGIVLPLQLDTIAFTDNLQPGTTTAAWLLFVAFVSGFSTRPTTGPRSLVRRHLKGSSIFCVGAMRLSLFLAWGGVHWSHDESVRERDEGWQNPLALISRSGPTSGGRCLDVS
jgi:hypothetical protein